MVLPVDTPPLFRSSSVPSPAVIPESPDPEPPLPTVPESPEPESEPPAEPLPEVYQAAERRALRRRSHPPRRGPYFRRN